ncbi:homoserine dehydrogenase [Thermodesulforhabdus norvegica]|uniref:Homoserine dehydrogenase n=1 Tax=Thermodesulforhabdus norvegica TaxID=39841 RepID=A0A1I4RBZ4_9BACT|nr:homoserine dehydrogenase [Thermodesulforhabdus norvegica]SFM49490.1 homoserine dehydrogenase [Thermodesulforhabdus norvegica]
MEQLNVGILGWGTVGCGVIEILQSHREEIKKRLGRELVLKKVADIDLERPRPVSLPREILTRDAKAVIEDPDIDIVVELIGGIEPARSFIMKALERGKHVVTANKALLAHHGNELFDFARKHQRIIAYEASVAGGIPFIKSLREGLAANNIDTVFGILNGTANFILTRMRESGLTFQEALKEAQSRGYAEADPRLDIEGIDTAHKLAITAAIAFNMSIVFDSIYVEGISGIDPLDIQFGEEFGYVLKLLAIARLGEGGVELRVHPTFIPSGHVLAGVRGAYNAVHVHGDAVGHVMLYGLGAGMMPTGSAVVADLMDLARDIAQGIHCRLPALGSYELNPIPVKPMDEVVTCYYFRFSAVDQPGVLSKISGILGRNNISISAVIQKGRHIGGAVPIVMVTHEAVESSVRRAIEEIDRLDVVRAKTQLIRIENLPVNYSEV